MKKSEVQIGAHYLAKVSDKLTVVRVDSVSQYGGWNATNVSTGRDIRIRGAAKLRVQVEKTAEGKWRRFHKTEAQS